MKKILLLVLGMLICAPISCKKYEATQLEIVSCKINGISLTNEKATGDVPFGTWTTEITFNSDIDLAKIDKTKIYFSGPINSNYEVSGSGKTLILSTANNVVLTPNSSYTLNIEIGEYLGGKINKKYQYGIRTSELIPEVPQISDDSLLTLVQYQTFKYFWDFGHPVSGLARERSSSGDIVTSGGSGFGVMAILVGIKRGFITREQGLERLNTIVGFLKNNSDKFHGVFSHWLNGQTGKAYPFSPNDNGGDLVEHAYVIQGLLTVYEYFKNSADAATLCSNIQDLWHNTEWDWYRKDGSDNLYWHWSPDKNWAMNMPISGYNECLITYVLAASSPTHSIPKQVYDNCWTRNGAMVNGKTFYNTVLPLGFDYGGPLFFTHYSFLGLNPFKIGDAYCSDYGTQNIAHAKINHAYCAANPKGYTGYSDSCWGLSASDIPGGYTASSPTNDVGTIAPTAAIASMPYTPEESMKALKYFYYKLNHKIWSDYGFKDAFNLSRNWVASDYIAIDQGPIVVMIENYRTGFLWDLFMQNEDVRAGLTKLGFTVK